MHSLTRHTPCSKHTGATMPLYADLHIHSPYSMATSRSMTPASLLAAAAQKGLRALGTGDALHPAWRVAWQEHFENEYGIVVVPSAEVEDQRRIHHLVLCEAFDQFGALEERFAPHSRNIGTAGRPHVSLSGEDIAEAVHAVGGLIGPAHAFTPWTSLYAHCDRVADCYGEEAIDFLELGLSADNSYGAAISDLAGIPFISNSDAHSPTPVKVGREFFRLDTGVTTVKGVLGAIRGGKIGMNAGFFPEEGKYNRTACIRCYRQFTLEEAEALGWRCPNDGKRIKMGVADRVRLLSDTVPTDRPPYLHIISLGEIIARVLGTASPATRRCTSLYRDLLESFGDEITILASVRIDDLRSVHAGVATAVDALRERRITLLPGGGGRYGSFSFQGTVRDATQAQERIFRI
jgi:uncharacterized protein (TIGR00375 family)